MKRVRRARPRVAALAMAASCLVAGCAKAPVDPLQLEGSRLTVVNETSSDWHDVEIWLNTYYRVVTPSIPAGRKFQTPLDNFVAGFGQRFDFHHMQVRDLRLKAKLPDGQPLELTKAFSKGGLSDTLRGLKPRR